MSKQLRWHVLPVLAGLLVAVCAPVGRADDRVTSLAGPWRFIRGGPELRDDDGPVPFLTFNDTIELPGTTATRQKGPPSEGRDTGQLTQPFNFVGVCWYMRDFELPDAWRGDRVTLSLERTKYSHCWVDGRSVGISAIVCTPQTYDLGTLTPGRHTITLAVDNRKLPPFGADAHQYSGNTQGNWNGVIGRIELRATDAVWFQDVQLYPDAAARRVTVKAKVRNAGSAAVDVALDAVDGTVAKQWTAHAAPGETETETTLQLGPNAALWDEFHPVLQTLTLRLTAPGVADSRTLAFGLRDFSTRGTQFTVNGQTIFLRGKHDACVFPLTGHPPMDVDGWLAYLRTCQSYGLNHIRFHTWCPPDAAFTAADQLGMYLQPELPFWGAFDANVVAALKPEADRILACYGNHPSFVMFSMGNEHWGGRELLDKLVTDLRAEDSRHLYVRGTSAFSYEGQPGPSDDYMINSDARPAGGQLMRVRGSNGGSSTQGHVQTGPANTTTDYTTAIAGSTKPTVSHEVGQYSVFPDFRQIAKYTGVTRAYNLEAFRDKVAAAGLLGEADDFAKASGALAALCYREEIESCLRTPGYGGFELLDLQDYPGQGSALVGMLDAFMDSKGIVSPERWQQFCASTVLLAKFPKYVWTSDETFSADIDLAQYGASDLSGLVVAWTLRDDAKKTLATGHLSAADAARGGVRSLGTVRSSLANATVPERLTLDLQLLGRSERTSYSLWVYPAQISVEQPGGLTLARTFDADARRALAAGRRVILICDQSRLLARTVGGAFAPDFWNFSFFHNRPATLGLLCDPTSPALTQFPTESHSDWQWFDAALNAQPVILDGLLPPEARPAVRVIDNVERCHQLGLIFEAKVGPGRLLVCATDLIALSPTHPECRQLLRSLLDYAASDRFAPQWSPGENVLTPLLRTTISLAGCTATASSFDKGWQGYEPRQIIDRNDDKGWKAAADAPGPAWCELQLPQPTDIAEVEITWPSAQGGYRYRIEASADGTHWPFLADERDNGFTTARHAISLKAKAARFVRVSIDAMPAGQPAGLNEIRLFDSPD